MKKIEYLIIIKKSGDFCANKDSFVWFLKVDPQIKIEDGTHLVHNGYSFVYTIGEKQDITKGYVYYEFNLEFEDQIPEKEAVSLTKILKTNILRIDKNTQIKLLWDDLNVEYNIKAYPIINNLENLMRKLISKFMILNVGIDWFRNSTTEDLQKKKRERNNDDFFFDEVFKLDFIDLLDILFTSYRKMKITEVDDLIKDINDNNSKKLSLIKEFYPISNWTRYFQSIVNKEESDITNLWTELYEIRNNIAHNRYINKGDFDRLIAIDKEIKPILQEAIKALNLISLSTDEQEAIKSTQEYQHKTRLIKVSKNLNVGISTLVEFLKSRGYDVAPNPNTKITQNQYELLVKHFTPIQDNHMSLSSFLKDRFSEYGGDNISFNIINSNEEEEEDGEEKEEEDNS